MRLIISTPIPTIHASTTRSGRKTCPPVAKVKYIGTSTSMAPAGEGTPMKLVRSGASPEGAVLLPTLKRAKRRMQQTA